MFFDKTYKVIVKKLGDVDEEVFIQATVQPNTKQQNESSGFFESGGMYISTPPQFDLDIYGETQFYLEFDNQLWHIKDKKKFISVIPHLEYTAYLENNDERFRIKEGGNTL